MCRLDFDGKLLSLGRGDIRDTIQTIQTSFSTSCDKAVICILKWKARKDKLPRNCVIEILLKIETDYCKLIVFFYVPHRKGQGTRWLTHKLS